MFISLPDYEAHVPRGLMPPKAQCWRALSLSLCTPWFVMSARFEESEDFISTFILASDRDVAASLESLQGEVTSLLYMQPSSIAERIDWQARAIREVWLAHWVDDPQAEALVFVDSDGHEISGLFSESPGSLRRTKLLAKIGSGLARVVS